MVKEASKPLIAVISGIILFKSINAIEPLNSHISTNPYFWILASTLGVVYGTKIFDRLRSMF